MNGRKSAPTRKVLSTPSKIPKNHFPGTKILIQNYIELGLQPQGTQVDYLGRANMVFTEVRKAVLGCLALK